MDLQTRLPHLRNTKINVGGVEYAIGDDHIVRGVSDSHGAELLSHANGVWAPLTTREPVAAAARPKLKPVLAPAAKTPAHEDAEDEDDVPAANDETDDEPVAKAASVDDGDAKPAEKRKHHARKK